VGPYNPHKNTVAPHPTPNGGTQHVSSFCAGGSSVNGIDGALDTRGPLLLLPPAAAPAAASAQRCAVLTPTPRSGLLETVGIPTQENTAAALAGAASPPREFYSAAPRCRIEEQAQAERSTTNPAQPSFISQDGSSGPRAV
jgi:hypothetical protein